MQSKKKTIDLEKTKQRRASPAYVEIMARYYNGVKINKLSDYYYHWTNALYRETHYPKNTAFKKLINSGNISIMKNKKNELTPCHENLIQGNVCY